MKLFFYHILKLTLLSYFITQLACGAETVEYDYFKYVSECKRKSLEVLSNKHLSKSINSKLKKNEANMLPQMNLKLSKNIGYSNAFDNEDYYSLSVTVDQEVYNPTLKANNNLIKFEKYHSNYLTKVKKSEVILRATILYLNWREFVELDNISSNNLSLLLNHLQNTNKRFRGGDLTKTDSWQSNENYILAKIKKNNTEFDKKNSREKLKSYTSFTPTKVFEVPDLYHYIAKLKMSDFDDFFKRNTKLRIMQNQVLLEDRRVKRESAKKLPIVIVNAELKKDIYTRGGIDEVEAKAYVRVSYPLFDFGVTSNSVNEIVNKKKSRKYELKHNVRETISSLKLQRDEIIKYKKNLDEYLMVEKYAVQSLRGIVREFKEGTKTNTDVIDAQKDLISSKENIVKLKYSLLKLEYNFIFNIGMMNENSLRGLF